MSHHAPGFFVGGHMDWSKLSGNRTYISAAALVAVGILSLSGQIDQATTQSLGALAVAALGVYLRAAIAKMPAEQRDRVERAIDLMDEIRAALRAGQPATGPVEQLRNETAEEFVERFEPRSIDPALAPRPQTIDGRSLTSDGSMLLSVLAAVLSLAACANAAAPRAIITGPNTGTPGEFLTLDASTSEGDPQHFRWSISPELRGRKQLLPSLTGERCTVATFPGRYVVTLAVANADGIDSLTWQIEIPGNAPCPPPEPQPVAPQPVVPPGPTPIPQPVTPQPVQPVNPVTPQPAGPPGPGEFGIALDVYRAALAATSPTRAQDCLGLAGECRRIAGTKYVSNNDAMLDLIGVLNRMADGWAAFRESLKTSKTILAALGRIKTAADLQRLLLELADAFDRAAR